MDDQPENVDHDCPDAILMKGLKVKLEPMDVVVDAKPMEQAAVESGKVKTEAENDEFVDLPSTSSDFNSKHSVILKKELKRRFSEDKRIDEINKAMKMEIEDDKEAIELLAIKGKGSTDQKSGTQIKTKVKNEVKEEIEADSDVKLEEKPLLNIKIEVKKEDDISLNPRSIPKTEEVKCENETKPKIKLEGISIGHGIEVKPDRNKLIKKELKCMEFLNIENEEDIDQKPANQVKTELKNEVKIETKEKLAVKAEDKPLIDLKIMKVVKEEQKEKRVFEKEKDDDGVSLGSIPEGPLSTRQKRRKMIETESVHNAGPSPNDIADSDEEVSQPQINISPPSTSSAIGATEGRESQCPHCQKLFPSERICKRHIWEKCKKRFKCRICKKRFPYPTHLEVHLRTHLNEKPFVCGVNGCEKRFTQGSAVVRHRRTHSDEKSFVCDHEGCGKKFSQNQTLVNHKRIHAGEKSFVCDYEGCGKAFVQRSVLFQHKLIHKKEKPHVCDINGCGKTFTWHSNLKRHQQTHQREN